MQDLTPSPLRFCLGIWLTLALGFNSVAVFAQDERNPVHNVRIEEPADAARVIVKLRRDSALLRKHALSATADAGKTLDAVTARANSLGARLGVSLRAGRALNEHAQVVSASGISSAALAERLAAEADVEYAVIDQRRTHFAVPNDPLYTQGPPISGNTGGPTAGQWYLRAPAGEITSGINATGAWDITTGSPDIVVAVLDTGVRPDHPDLANRLLAGYDMVSDVSTANDGDGREADASDPGDWVTASESSNQSSPFYQCDVADSSWHGTQTASLIGAASNNGVGMASVAGGVKLLPVRVLGKCGGYDSDIIAGMNWAAGLPVPGVPTNPTPARVINMSLGGSGACPQSYLDAVNAIIGKQNPAVIVAAAGNSSGHAVSAPANCAGVIGVAGLRHIGTKVGFSDLGPEVSISAPGGNCVNTASGAPCLYPILTATNTGTTTPLASSYTDSFNASLGTSFSAPLVAGTVALMLSVQPSLTPVEVKAALQNSVRAFPSASAGSSSQSGTVQDCHAPNGSDQLECYCTTSTCGAGMLDAASALATVTTTMIPKANQTIGAISFSPTTLTVDGTTRASATATSGLAVSFSTATPSVCTVSGDTITGITAGTCTIAASQTGDANYNAATQVTQSITVGCMPYSLSPSSQSAGAGGLAGNISVTASTGCAWTAVSNASWITITSGASGSGSGSVVYSVTANTGTGSRTGTLIIGDQTFTVSQAGTTGTTCTPGADTDSDGISDCVELTEGTNPAAKDNDIFVNARLFVMQQYRDFLSREGDSGEITAWTDAISGGTYTQAQVIDGFFNSPEFQGVASPVVRLYFAYFLRIPDYAGLQAWLSQYRAGVSLDSISNSFANSPEFLARYGALDNGGFVTLIYNNVLGRTPDTAGYNAWLAQLNSGAMTRGQVMLGFSESAEYQVKSYNSVYVTMMYVGMLRRSPEQAGFDAWAAYLNAGMSSTGLIDGFIAAPEYRGRFL